MPYFKRDDISIYYEIHGEGYPILLLAPGGMRSSIPVWTSGSEWNPITSLSPHYQVIAMDQRNAGQSSAPISGNDNWSTYTNDHIALLDHLNIAQCHVLGGCIGGPYCLGLMEDQPGRVTSAVLQQSIGADNNRDTFYDLFDSWADALKPARPEVPDDAWVQFRSNMFDGDFVYNVTREFVAGCEIPMLVLMGTDVYHPEVTSREIASLAPNAILIEKWKDPEKDNTVENVLAFLAAHTP
ncbi:MAG: alpha/beta hydrolase [Proteobacteria bacterium]|nr:alpha/beta hydrolase [Pseudomonadota bacterium]